jgi:membrane-associated phospholipid phosphatase
MVAVLVLLAPFIDLDRAPRFVRFIRVFYPQALIVFFFQESILLSTQFFGGRVHDAIFAAADRAIFGYQPSRWFHRALDDMPWFNELMFGSYFLYYVLLAVTPWISWFRGMREKALRMMFALSGMMAVIFIWYIFFRVEGPKYWFSDLRSVAYGQFRGGVFVSFFRGVFRTTTLSGAAFPSTHVAFTLTMAIFAYRTDRRLLAFYLLCAALVLFSTVYLYAHYFADVLGGLVAAFLLEPIFWQLFPSARLLCDGPGGRTTGLA